MSKAGFGQMTALWTPQQSINPSPNSDYPVAMAVDGSGVYVGGYDEANGSGNGQWRVEKRDLTTGALIPAFGVGGVVTTNPSPMDEVIHEIVLTSTAMYLVGYDRASGWNYELRIEKRDLTTGALIPGFGTAGVAREAGWGWPGAAAADASGLYIAGVDWRFTTTYDWRIQKRDLMTGALIPTFGTAGVLISAPSAGTDHPYAVTVDATGVYIAGEDESLGTGNTMWRVEKRDKTTGALIPAFGVGGVITSNPVGMPWGSSNSMTSDATGLYLCGSDTNSINYQWRMEKRDLTTGALIPAFGVGGVIIENPSNGLDMAREICVTATGVYIAGCDENLGAGNSQWRIEHRDKVTGALICVQNSNPSSGVEIAFGVVSDATGVYVAGCDQTPVTNYQWRVEKYDGCLTVPLNTTTAATNILCNGQCTGTATATPSGGTGPYTYSWTGGQTTVTATGLCSGSYTVIVTDALNATSSSIVNISQPPTPLTSSVTSANTTCGNSNGTATVTASGGTAGYTYLWTPTSQTTPSISGLAGGSYTVTTTDQNGCAQLDTVIVANNSTPSILTSLNSNVLCYGDSTGSATANVVGGSTPYNFLWSNSQTTTTVSGLIAGTYSVTVTDNDGCTDTSTVVITQPAAALSAAISGNNSTCGNPNGSATVIASGGTAAYTYFWNPSSQTSATAIGLGAAVYNCVITDNNGCTTTTSITIGTSSGPVASLQNSSDVTCFGLTDGSATVSANGNGPFTYSWSPSGGNAASASGLSATSYTVTITDVNNCSATQTLSITQPNLLVSTVTSVNGTCGLNNGTASGSATGGTGPFTYNWSNSSTTQQITGLSAGTYSVVITDANGCTSTSSNTVTVSGSPTVTVTSSLSVLCFGQSNGAATVVTTGAQGPYAYSWLPTGGNSATANNIPAGTYTVTVTSSDGCTQTQTVSITQPTLLMTVGSSLPEDCNSTNGNATIVASGGTPNYTYIWNTGGTNSSLSGIGSGSYSCVVTDANGCTQSTNVVVSSTGSAVANAGVDITISQGQTTTLTGTGGLSFSWSPTTSLDCSNCQNPIASPTVTTTYILTVTDSLGCTDSDTVTVFVDITCGEVFLPNAFSPNGDYQNDVYYVRGNCISELRFEIYNRWGEQVFSTTSTANGWDGTWRDKPCESAVYTYLLRATLLDGTQIEKDGNISLVK